MIEFNKTIFYFSTIPLSSIMTELGSVKSVACNAATICWISSFSDECVTSVNKVLKEMREEGKITEIMSKYIQ